MIVAFKTILIINVSIKNKLILSPYYHILTLFLLDLFFFFQIHLNQTMQSRWQIMLALMSHRTWLWLKWFRSDLL